MSSPANSRQANEALQGMGTQFTANAAASPAFRTEDMTRDLQRTVAVDDTASNQTSINSARASSKTKSHEPGCIKVNRCATSANRPEIDHRGGHVGEQGYPIDIAHSVQHRATTRIRDTPWSIVGESKADGGPRIPIRSDAVSIKSSSTAATKGSLE